MASPPVYDRPPPRIKLNETTEFKVQKQLEQGDVHMMRAVNLSQTAIATIMAQIQQEELLETQNEARWAAESETKDATLQMAKQAPANTVINEAILQFHVTNVPNQSGEETDKYFYVTGEMLRYTLDKARDRITWDFDNEELVKKFNCITRDIIPRSERLLKSILLGGPHDIWTNATDERNYIARYLGSIVLFALAKQVLQEDQDLLAFSGEVKLINLHTVSLGPWSGITPESTKLTLYYGRNISPLRTPVNTSNPIWRATHTGKDAIGWLKLRVLMHTLTTYAKASELLSDTDKFCVVKYIAELTHAMSGGHQDTANFLVTNVNTYIPVQDLPMYVIAPLWTQMITAFNIQFVTSGRKFSDWSGYDSVTVEEVKGCMPLVSSAHRWTAWSALQDLCKEIPIRLIMYAHKDELLQAHKLISADKSWASTISSKEGALPTNATNLNSETDLYVFRTATSLNCPWFNPYMPEICKHVGRKNLSGVTEHMEAEAILASALLTDCVPAPTFKSNGFSQNIASSQISSQTDICGAILRATEHPVKEESKHQTYQKSDERSVQSQATMPPKASKQPKPKTSTTGVGEPPPPASTTTITTKATTLDAHAMSASASTVTTSSAKTLAAATTSSASTLDATTTSSATTLRTVPTSSSSMPEAKTTVTNPMVVDLTGENKMQYLTTAVMIAGRRRSQRVKQITNVSYIARKTTELYSTLSTAMQNTPSAQVGSNGYSSNAGTVGDLPLPVHEATTTGAAPATHGAYAKPSPAPLDANEQSRVQIYDVHPHSANSQPHTAKMNKTDHLVVNAGVEGGPSEAMVAITFAAARERTDATCKKVLPNKEVLETYNNFTASSTTVPTPLTMKISSTEWDRMSNDALTEQLERMQREVQAARMAKERRQLQARLAELQAEIDKETAPHLKTLTSLLPPSPIATTTEPLPPPAVPVSSVRPLTSADVINMTIPTLTSHEAHPQIKAPSKESSTEPKKDTTTAPRRSRSPKGHSKRDKERKYSKSRSRSARRRSSPTGKSSKTDPKRKHGVRSPQEEQPKSKSARVGELTPRVINRKADEDFRPQAKHISFADLDQAKPKYLPTNIFGHAPSEQQVTEAALTMKQTKATAARNNLLDYATLMQKQQTDSFVEAQTILYRHALYTGQVPSMSTHTAFLSWDTIPEIISPRDLTQLEGNIAAETAHLLSRVLMFLDIWKHEVRDATKALYRWMPMAYFEFNCLLAKAEVYEKMQTAYNATKLTSQTQWKDNIQVLTDVRETAREVYKDFVTTEACRCKRLADASHVLTAHRHYTRPFPPEHVPVWPDFDDKYRLGQTEMWPLFVAEHWQARRNDGRYEGTYARLRSTYPAASSTNNYRVAIDKLSSEVFRELQRIHEVRKTKTPILAAQSAPLSPGEWPPPLRAHSQPRPADVPAPSRLSLAPLPPAVTAPPVSSSTSLLTLAPQQTLSPRSVVQSAQELDWQTMPLRRRRAAAEQQTTKSAPQQQPVEYPPPPASAKVDIGVEHKTRIVHPEKKYQVTLEKAISILVPDNDTLFASTLWPAFLEAEKKLTAEYVEECGCGHCIPCTQKEPRTLFLFDPKIIDMVSKPLAKEVRNDFDAFFTETKSQVDSYATKIRTADATYKKILINRLQGEITEFAAQIVRQENTCRQALTLNRSLRSASSWLAEDQFGRLDSLVHMIQAFDADLSTSLRTRLDDSVEELKTKLQLLIPAAGEPISSMLHQLDAIKYNKHLMPINATKILCMAKGEKALNPRLEVTLDCQYKTEVLADSGASFGAMGALTEDKLHQSRRDRGLAPLVTKRLPPIRLHCVGSVFTCATGYELSMTVTDIRGETHSLLYSMYVIRQWKEDAILLGYDIGALGLHLDTQAHVAYYRNAAQMQQYQQWHEQLALSQTLGVPCPPLPAEAVGSIIPLLTTATAFSTIPETIPAEVSTDAHMDEVKYENISSHHNTKLNMNDIKMSYDNAPEEDCISESARNQKDDTDAACPGRPDIIANIRILRSIHLRGGEGAWVSARVLWPKTHEYTHKTQTVFLHGNSPGDTCIRLARGIQACRGSYTRVLVSNLSHTHKYLRAGTLIGRAGRVDPASFTSMSTSPEEEAIGADNTRTGVLLRALSCSSITQQDLRPHPVASVDRSVSKYMRSKAAYNVDKIKITAPVIETKGEERKSKYDYDAPIYNAEPDELYVAHTCASQIDSVKSHVTLSDLPEGREYMKQLHVDVRNALDKIPLIQSEEDLPSHMRGMKIGEGWSDVRKWLALTLMAQFSDVFTENAKGPRPAHIPDAEELSGIFDTGSSGPISRPPFRVAQTEKHVIKANIDEMLKNNICRPSRSPWAAPVILVDKPDGSVRFCVDYRELNKITKDEIYPLPRVDDVLSSFQGQGVFSTGDLASGYWQIPLNEKDKEKTAFITHEGLYEFNVMPFGPKNAPRYFQRYMDRVLAGLKWSCALIYIDDVIIYSSNFNKHMYDVLHVLTRLREANLSLKASKCNFFSTQVQYLGHQITAEGIKPNTQKTNAITKWARPTTKTKVRGFLGTTGYYRRFIKDYAKVANPLTELTKKEVPEDIKDIWGEKEEEAFTKLKAALTSETILFHPDFDRHFYVITDASKLGLGAVLAQIDKDGNERVVEYISRALQQAEKAWNTTELEALGVLWACETFRPYVYGRKFTVVTDHVALKWLMARQTPGRLQRWGLRLQEYDFEVVHRAGKLNVADGPSRAPLPLKEAQCIDAEDRMDARMYTTLGIHEDEHTHVCTSESGCLYALTKSDAIKKELEDSRRVELLEVIKKENKYPTLPSSEEMRREQLKNKYTGDLLRYLENGTIPGTTQKEKDKNKGGIDKLSRMYLIRNGLLIYMKRLSKARQAQDSTLIELKIMVPNNTALIQRIINAHHAPAFYGHMGSSKTLKRVQQHFHFKQMERQVRAFTRSCHLCQVTKGAPDKRQGIMKPILVDKPFDVVAMDLCGPWMKTPEGFEYLMVVKDHFTRYVVLIPIKQKTAECVGDALMDNFFNTYGYPKFLLSDRGAEFRNSLVKRMTERLEINQLFTTAYHPQGNGKVERVNRVINECMRAYVDTYHKDWKNWVSAIQYAINTSVHEATGKTPFELVFNRQPNSPVALHYNIPILLADEQLGVHHTKRHAEAIEQVRKFQKLAQEQSIMQANKFRKDTPLKEGDMVMLYDPAFKKGIKRRTQCRWHVHPFLLKSLTNSGLTALIVDRYNKEQSVHVSRLKLFHFNQTTGDDSAHEDTPSQLIPEEAREQASVSLQDKPAEQMQDADAPHIPQPLSASSGQDIKPEQGIQGDVPPLANKISYEDIKISSTVLYWAHNPDGIKQWYIGSVHSITEEDKAVNKVSVQVFNTHDTDRKINTKRWKHTWIDPKATESKRKRAVTKGGSAEDVGDVEAWQVNPKPHYVAFINHIDLDQILLVTKLNKLRQLDGKAITMIQAFQDAKS